MGHYAACITRERHYNFFRFLESYRLLHQLGHPSYVKTIQCVWIALKVTIPDDLRRVLAQLFIGFVFLTVRHLESQKPKTLGKSYNFTCGREREEKIGRGMVANSKQNSFLKYHTFQRHERSLKASKGVSLCKIYCFSCMRVKLRTSPLP